MLQRDLVCLHNFWWSLLQSGGYLLSSFNVFSGSCINYNSFSIIYKKWNFHQQTILERCLFINICRRISFYPGRCIVYPQNHFGRNINSQGFIVPKEKINLAAFFNKGKFFSHYVFTNLYLLITFWIHKYCARSIFVKKLEFSFL